MTNEASALATLRHSKQLLLITTVVCGNLHETMASTTRVCSVLCMLCRCVVPPKKITNLFKPMAIKVKLVDRITSLLDVGIAEDDGLPPYVCDKCRTRVVSLEKSLNDLVSFKEMARCSRSAFLHVRAPLKRGKATSTDVGVSPDTVKERPRAKKRLIFTSEYKTHFLDPDCDTLL